MTTQPLAAGDVKALITMLNVLAGSGADKVTAHGQRQIVASLMELTEQYPDVQSAAPDVDPFMCGLAGATINIGQHSFLRLFAAYYWGDLAGSGKLGPDDHIDSVLAWAATSHGPATCSAPSPLDSWSDAMLLMIDTPAGGPPDYITTFPDTPGPNTLIVDWPILDERPPDGAAKIAVFEMGLFDGTKWTNSSDVAHHGNAWPGMAAELGALVEHDVPPNSAFRLAYLLIGMSTSPDAAQRSTVARIVGLPAGSTVYPNANFAWQLIYLMLMDWVDPNGFYQWTAVEMLDQTMRLKTTLPNHDPGSSLLSTALAAHISVLRASPNYPFVDGNAPEVPFDERRSDTQFAVGKAWAGLRS